MTHYWEGRAPYRIGAGEGGDQESSDEENIALDLVRPLCPELAALDVVVGYNDTFYSPGPEPLPRLESVTLAYDNTEDGFDLAGLRHLASAAPNIQSVVGFQVSGCDERCDLGNVTHLRLGASAMSLTDLRFALLSCPRLKSLEYSAAGSVVGFEQFTPFEMEDALVEHLPRLKSLVLDLDESPSDGMVVDEGWVMRSLGGLRELRRLEVDTRCLVPHRNPHSTTDVRLPDGQFLPFDPGMIAAEAGLEALVGLLPESICELRIWRDGYGPEVAKLGPAVVGLAMAERFACLRRVCLEGRGAEQVVSIGPAFEARGIEFVIRGE